MNEELLDKAIKESNFSKNVDSRFRILCQLDNPDWNNKGRVHDWRNYIDEDIRRLWGTLSRQAQLVAYIHGIKLANAEEWD